MKKKIFALFLALTVLLSLVACTTPNTDTDSNPGSDSVSSSASNTATDAATDEVLSDTHSTDTTTASSSTVTNSSTVSNGTSTNSTTSSATKTTSSSSSSVSAPEDSDVPVYDSSLDHKILVIDNTAASVLVLDLDNCNGNWSMINWSNSKSTVKVKEFSTGGDTNVSDVKYRYSSYYKKDVLIATSSMGYVWICDYNATSSETGLLYSVYDFIPNEQEISLYNAHAAEILPNGDVVVATSGFQQDGDGSNYRNGGLHYYPAGSDKRAAFLSIPFAHAVVWDDQSQCLWAIGFEGVVAVKVNGSGANATMEKIAGKGRKMSNFSGHDMVPAYGMDGKYWVTDNYATYLFDSVTGEWDADINYSQNLVKGIAYFEDGTMVQSTWARSLTLYTTNSANSKPQKRTLSVPGQVYKVRTFSKNYH